MNPSFLPKDLLDEIQELIRHNSVKEALEKLNSYFYKSQNSYNKNVTLFSSEWKSLKQRSLAGTIPFSEEIRSENSIKSRLIDFISGFTTDEAEKSKSVEESAFLKIFEHEDNIWDLLEKICIDAVLIGGITAMSYYRDAWDVSKVISGEIKNPSMFADFQATIAILRSLDSRLHDLASKLNCKLSYFGEETTDQLLEMAESALSDRVKNSIIYNQNNFFKPSMNSIRVIFDAIDGTSNFTRGLPLFCSGVAIIIDDTARIAAIYDPVHHVVYSAILKGPDSQPERNAHAYAWHISSGNREILKDKVDKINKKYNNPLKESVGIHLTRNSTKRHILRDFLGLGAYEFSTASFSNLKKMSWPSKIFKKIKSIFKTEEIYSYRQIEKKIEKSIGEKLSTEEFTSIFDNTFKPNTATYNYVEQLSTNTGGVFALNSGLFALAEIGRGALGSFVNPVTNPWDVTAGEVLIKAVGGCVTDMEGNPIRYTKPGPISVMASRTEEIYDHLKNILQIPD